jgi:dolichol kinase
VYGHVVMSISTGGNFMSWYAYTGVQNLASGDTLAATIQHQFVIGS